MWEVPIDFLFEAFKFYVNSKIEEADHREELYSVLAAVNGVKFPRSRRKALKAEKPKSNAELESKLRAAGLTIEEV